MSFDVIIQNGTIVDGTGKERYKADIAIKDGKIAAIGDNLGDAKKFIDASQHIVTPGFVDIHTHFDGQVTWDPYLTPSGWHGVTTVVMGNCGVGFAPVHASDYQWIIDLMEGVEDIPGAALTEGLKWDWESFPEYLDALDKSPRAMDIAAQVPHGALRFYVMGKRGAKHEAPTREDLDQMSDIVEEAVKAGAVGFSTSRTMLHKDIHGELVPGTYAAEDELLAIANAMEKAQSGVFQMTSNHVDMDDELDWMEKIAKQTTRPVCFNLVQTDEDPGLWQKVLAHAKRVREEGGNVVPNVAGRPAGILMNWQCVAHPFARHQCFMEIADKPFAEMLEILKTPEFKQKLMAEELPQLPPFETFITRGYHKMFILDDTVDYEPGPEKSLAAMAKATGRDPREIAYEALMADDGQGLLYFPIFNYTANNMDVLFDLLNDPETCVSLGDGGAHCATICDASIPTFMLTHWARDRSRGQKLSLETVIKKQTKDTAEVYGFMDRGILAPGYKADINVIDFDNLKLHKPVMTYDLPAGGRRLLQKATGYKATLVAGEVVFENGEATGNLPGKLLRGSQSAPSASA